MYIRHKGHGRNAVVLGDVRVQFGDIPLGGARLPFVMELNVIVGGIGRTYFNEKSAFVGGGGGVSGMRRQLFEAPMPLV